MTNLPNTVEKQVLRGHVLRIADAAEPLGAGTEVIHGAIKQYGFSVSKEDISECCNYLQGKGLIRIQNVRNEVLGISRDIAHITPDGVDVLEGTKPVSGIALE